MTRSNLTIRPNVYIRSAPQLADDLAFMQQIRGRSAITKALSRLGIPVSDLRRVRGALTRDQLSQVVWQNRCICGAMPEGPIRTPAGLEVVFRCPKQHCDSGNMVARVANLDLHLVSECTQRLGEPLVAFLAQLLEDRSGSSPRGAPDSSVVRRPFPIRLSRTQNYFFSDEDIESALRDFLGRQR